MSGSMDTSEQGYYRKVESALMRVAGAVEQHQRIDLAELTRLAAELVDAIQDNDQLVVEALSSPPGPPLVTNLINVGILGTKVGIGLGYYGYELRRLALAGLLHDVGIFAIPQQLLSKSARLTTEERTVVENHPRVGAEIVAQFGPEYAWLGEVVLQAHERGKGQGYPNKLKGREINELAQIIGLVDIFDALVSPRPYRRRLLPHEAVRELLVTERTAFPREIMKALVEQLSIYPLGTIVRLSGGEQGVVTKINPRYPSRPSVRVDGDDALGGAARILDLATLPLVSIVETLDPPAVERVSFESSEKPGGGAPRSSGSATDQFSALLESLDAIADVIQTAVDRKEPDSSESTAETAVQNAGEVRREILGLFALEAREWLNQIQTALERMDRTIEQPRRAKLANLMLQGVTNLARSAATVGLTALEEMATNLLPLLQAAGKHERAVASHHLTSLREGLTRIMGLVHELGPRQEEAPPSPEAASAPSGAHEPAPVSVPMPPVEAGEESNVQVGEPALATALPILDALRQLHDARGRSEQPRRDVLETVIQRAEEEAARGVPVADARAIGRILKDLDEQDEYFLAQMEARVPALVATLSNIRSDSEGTGPHPQALASVLQDIDGLYNAADRVAAVNITMFLHGLRSFLQVTTQNRPAAVDERLAAVQERLAALVPLARQWVDIGRLERTAIFEILPLA
ncbi:MAG: HD domain-containing protein [Nitrospiraceae bacterium]|nr:HD domain-containing protein [Nitrospiraceae bacterium]